MAKKPIDILLDKVEWRCAKCGKKINTCDCWRKCPDVGCSWYIEKGHKCRNPKHSKT
jgi:hypothetical protein